MNKTQTENNQKLVYLYKSLTRKCTEISDTNLIAGLEESHRILVSEDSFKLLLLFQESNIDKQRELLGSSLTELAEAFIECLFIFENDKGLLTFLLLNVDAILIDNPENIKPFIAISRSNSDKNLIKLLQKILTRKENSFNLNVNDSAARILSLMLSDFDSCAGFFLDNKTMISFLLTGASLNRSPISDYAITFCLKNLLIVPKIPLFFLSLNGFSVLQVLFDRNQKDLQVLYFILLNFWILSFEEEFKPIATDPKTLLIGNIIGVLKKLAREKLTRVALRIFKNLSRWEQCVVLMIDNNLLNFLTNELKKNIKDEKLKENILYLVEILERNYKIVSSWEQYIKEIKTEKLLMGHCHTEKFWKEHFKKVEEGEFWVIKKLVELLDSKDENTQSVACYDLGEFSRLHPFSKVILEQEQGRTKLMLMVNRENSIVREAALIAVQKLMINNWQLVS